ncbi:MAG: ATP-binding protein, partial [Bacilli bacterium]|nr:ATP-binding protein [Bacilli bacterium]
MEKAEYKKRIVDEAIETHLKVSGAVCIEGPKSCGKTWSSSYHAKSEYFVGDPSNGFSNRRLAELDPFGVLEGEAPRMIDEWQEVPSLWDAVRAKVDRSGKKGQIILTGSSTPQTKGILHSGIGRITRLRMGTMSLYETLDSSGQVSLKELCEGKLKNQAVKETPLEKLAYFIVRGGWPNNLSVSEDDAGLLPLSYMEGVVHDDLRKLDGFRYNEQKARRLLLSLARNESTAAGDLTLLNDIQENADDPFSRNTLLKYLEAMNRLFLFDNQPPFSPNLRSSLRVKQKEKRHFADPAMAAAMLGLTPQKLLGDVRTFGFMFEALAEHDLRIYAESFGGKLFHYQDYKDNEIDAVIELPSGEWCGFE